MKCHMISSCIRPVGSKLPVLQRPAIQGMSAAHRAVARIAGSFLPLPLRLLSASKKLQIPSAVRKVVSHFAKRRRHTCNPADIALLKEQAMPESESASTPAPEPSVEAPAAGPAAAVRSAKAKVRIARKTPMRTLRKRAAAAALTLAKGKSMLKSSVKSIVKSELTTTVPKAMLAVVSRLQSQSLLFVSSRQCLRWLMVSWKECASFLIAIVANLVAGFGRRLPLEWHRARSRLTGAGFFPESSLMARASFRRNKGGW